MSSFSRKIIVARIEVLKCEIYHTFEQILWCHFLIDKEALKWVKKGGQGLRLGWNIFQARMLNAEDSANVYPY